MKELVLALLFFSFLPSAQAELKKEFRCRAGYQVKERKNKKGAVLARWCENTKKRKSGPYQRYFSSGKVRVTGNYRCNRQSGKWIYYNESGYITETIFHDERLTCSSFIWGRFQVSPFLGFQPSTPDQSTGKNIWLGSVMGSWNPYYRLSRTLGLEFSLGAAFIKGSSSSSGNFLAIEAIPYVIYQPTSIQPFAIALGIGSHTWLGERTHLISGMNIYYLLEKPLLKVIDRFVFNYSTFFYPGNTTIYVRAGIGLAF